MILADAGSIQVGVSVLAACWRQYSSLILLEDRNLVLNPDPVIQHWFGALQVALCTRGFAFVNRNKRFWTFSTWLEHYYNFRVLVSLSSIGHKQPKRWMQP